MTFQDKNSNGLWINKIIGSRIFRRVKSPLLKSFILFGLPLDLLFIAFFNVRCDYISSNFLYSYIFALAWLNIGPFLIWYYDERLLPEFFCRVEDILPEPNLHIRLAEKYSNTFSKRFWIFTIPWAILLFAIFIAANKVLINAGLFGIKDPWYWVIAALILWMSFLNSIGYWGVYITIKSVREISKHELKINVLHADNLGGLSCVGYFSIGTAILFSSGSLFVPVAILVVSEGSNAIWFVYIAVIFYSLFILFSFLDPTYQICKKSEQIRERILDQLSAQHKKLTQNLISQSIKHKEKIESYHELARIRSEYDDYRNIKLFPFDTEISAKLISSVLLPFAFVLIEKFLIP